MIILRLVFTVMLIISTGFYSETSCQIELGRLETGAVVSFNRSASGEWGIEIKGTLTPHILQSEPVRIEIFRTEDDIRRFASGYVNTEKNSEGVLARAEIAFEDDVVFKIEDQWTINSEVLSVYREIKVMGNAPGCAFNSALMLALTSETPSESIEYFVPSVLYRGPGGNENPRQGVSQRFAYREDYMAAPMAGLSFSNGASLTMLDPSPKGNTTYEDAGNRVTSVILDDRLKYGAFGTFPKPDGGVEFGFWYPGSMPPPVESALGTPAGDRDRLLRRYHRIRDGYTDSYEIMFRFANNESFPVLTRNSWRWAWKILDPPITYIDAELVRNVLLDHLADRVMTVEGRTGIPWIFQATSGLVWNRPDDMRCAMGFVGKNIEAADQLLREGDRDKSARGQRMRNLGLSIIETFIRLVPMDPPAGEAFDLLTGEPTVSFPPSSWRGNQANGLRMFLRAPSEDMTMLLHAYNREKTLGRDHPEWLTWCKDFADWLLPQQRPDGSFPRSWRPGTTTVVEPSGSSSYNPVPMLILLSKAVPADGSQYLNAAVKAGEYIWSTYGERGYFVGGTMDNPNVVDKEAGMLSLEAFLALYEETKNTEWLSRAQAAANYAETYIWIWNVPMPDDASEGGLAWKKGVPTVGLQGIGARPGGGVDNYMDWSVPAYAKLYKYTDDPHYLDVARVLLHCTKSMLALPGRTYDLAGPGWQQEHWSIGDSRGYSSHRAWLPWVSTNHLYSITGLEECDPDLFKLLITHP